MPLVLRRRKAAHQYRIDAAVYFATGVWPTGLPLRLRWASTAPKTSINPLKELA